MPLSPSHGGRPAHRRWTRSPYPRQSRRTALPVVAALAAAPLLSACGGTPHPGAAAVVDGGRITVSEVQGRVADVRKAQADSPRAKQLVRATGQLNQLTLRDLIGRRVLDRAADDAGVHVTRREVQQVLHLIERQAGGAKRLRQGVVEQEMPIAPDQIEEVVRSQVVQEKLARKLGADLGTPQGQQKLFGTLKDASKAMHIQVNPRYGAWNEEKGLLDFKVREPWLRSGKADS